MTTDLTSHTPLVRAWDAYARLTDLAILMSCGRLSRRQQKRLERMEQAHMDLMRALREISEQTQGTYLTAADLPCFPSADAMACRPPWADAKICWVGLDGGVVL